MLTLLDLKMVGGQDFFSFWNTFSFLEVSVVGSERLILLQARALEENVRLRWFPFVDGKGYVRADVLRLLNGWIWEADCCDDFVRDDDESANLDVDGDILFELIIDLVIFSHIFISVHEKTCHMEILSKSPAIDRLSRT